MIIKFYAYLLKLLLSPQKRTPTAINAEYNDGVYKRILDEKKWESLTLEELNKINLSSNSDNSESIQCVIEGKWARMSYSDLHSNHQKQFIQIMKKYIGDEKIVELGCGYGRNLFTLKGLGIKNQLEGYDISQNAIQVGRSINEKYGMDIKFDVLDMTKPLSPAFGEKIIKGSTIITAASLEQLKIYVPRIIEELRRYEPKQVIHFENIEKPTTILGIANVLYKKSQGYQNNLLRSLKDVKITEIKKLDFDGNPFNQISAVRWIDESF